MSAIPPSPTFSASGIRSAMSQARTLLEAPSAPFAEDYGLPLDVRSAVKAVITGKSSSMQMVLLTQLAAKASFPSFPADVLQASGGTGVIDLRSAYKNSVRPEVIEMVKARSSNYIPPSDPYVSNPFREPRVDADWVARRRMPGAENLLIALDWINHHQESAGETLLAALSDFGEWLDAGGIDMTPPIRIHVAAAAKLVLDFQSHGETGDRLERVVNALFRFIGEQTGGWDQVIGHSSNDPSPIDHECMKGDKCISLGESKAKPWGVTEIRQLGDLMRQLGTQKAFFVTTREFMPTGNSDLLAEIQACLLDRLTYGQRIDIHAIEDLLPAWLSMADVEESAIPAFLSILGKELCEHSQVPVQRAWADHLRNL